MWSFLYTVFHALPIHVWVQTLRFNCYIASAVRALEPCAGRALDPNFSDIFSDYLLKMIISVYTEVK